MNNLYENINQILPSNVLSNSSNNCNLDYKFNLWKCNNDQTCIVDARHTNTQCINSENL
jgi:hypothetical protein